MELSQFMGHAGKNHGLSEIIIQKMAYNGPKYAWDSIKRQMQINMTEQKAYTFKMLILYTENPQRIPLISFIFIKFAELHDCLQNCQA